MKRDDVFPSKYLKAADLNGKPVAITIKSAPYETFKNPEGKEQGKTVLYFVGGKKALPLNIVNWRRDLRRRHRRLAGPPDRTLPHGHADGCEDGPLHPHSPPARNVAVGGPAERNAGTDASRKAAGREQRRHRCQQKRPAGSDAGTDASRNAAGRGVRRR